MILHADRKERLDKFLARMLPEHSRTKLAKLASEGQVLVNGKSERASFELSPGLEVALDQPAEAEAHDLSPADIPLDVRYEDESLLVINKPRGLAVHPAASLKEPSMVNALLSRAHGLSQAGGSFRPGIVHRLDKDTTGLIIVAKTDAAHVNLAKQIEKKTAERRYVAVAGGRLDREQLTIDAAIARNKANRLKMAIDAHGKPAITHVRKLATIPAGLLLAVRLETGRTHQIRVHLMAIGLPVIGDILYAPKDYRQGPLQLHAAYLSFAHPVTGKKIDVYAEPPEDFFGRDQVSRENVADWDNIAE